MHAIIASLLLSVPLPLLLRFRRRTPSAVIRGLAQQRGRNTASAKRAVREAMQLCYLRTVKQAV